MKTTTIKRIKDTVRNPKVQLALSLAVVSAGMLAPEESVSACRNGDNGDCDKMSNNDFACVKGFFWNDCH
jgi:hypothetical protein